MAPLPLNERTKAQVHEDARGTICFNSRSNRKRKKIVHGFCLARALCPCQIEAERDCAGACDIIGYCEVEHFAWNRY